MTRIHTTCLRATVIVSALAIFGAASPALADPDLLGHASLETAAHVDDPANPAPVPRAQCGPGSNPESDLQGRVLREEIDNGRAAEGYTCNTELLGRSGPQSYQGGAGGFKVFRYVDASGHECAYYDTTLLVGANVSAGQVPGVWVLDMADPSQPQRTAELLTPAMVTPHESLVLNEERGLLVAVEGTPATAPGHLDIYDVTDDCRYPVLRSSLPVGVLGHESGMAPDGNTYYVASLDAGTLSAVDITIPEAPVPLFVIGDYRPHGVTISDDGNRAYLADRTGLIILDVSQVQARVLNPQVTEISRLNWQPIQSTPQVAIPVTIQGHPYLIEVDEFSDADDNAGAARIIDIANELEPQIISNIRLEVHSTENRASLLGDYGSGPSDILGFMGYNAHYCEVPQRHEPAVLACSFILSGMRLFDIRDAYHPTEIAYFNGPILSENGAPGFDPAAYAMSAPAFVPERNEIWYSDANSGFYSVRITNGAWPRPEPEDPAEGTKVTGGGWLETGDGEKINFGFNAKQKASGPQGQLQLNDKTAGVKIHLSEVTAFGAVGGSCGGIAAGPNALEFQGTGTFEGAGIQSDAAFLVCVEDNGEPGNSGSTNTPDRIYLQCLDGCDYDTASRTPDSAIDGGNIQLHEPAAASEPGAGGASVLVLGPVTLSEAVTGGVQTLTVTAYGADNLLFAGENVSLAWADATGAPVSLSGVTGLGGIATFQVTVLAGSTERIAHAGPLESNAVEVTGLPSH